MMACLDWEKAETDRIEAQVALETDNGRIDTGGRGMGELWKLAQEEAEKQEASYLSLEHQREQAEEESCIVVQA